MQCRSHIQAAKDRAMLARQKDRLSLELLKVDRCPRRRSRAETGPAERRIGGWQGRSQAADRWREVALVFEPKGRACALPRCGPVASDH